MKAESRMLTDQTACTTSAIASSSSRRMEPCRTERWSNCRDHRQEQDLQNLRLKAIHQLPRKSCKSCLTTFGILAKSSSSIPEEPSLAHCCFPGLNYSRWAERHSCHACAQPAQDD